MTRAIDELMRENDVGRLVLLLHRADRACRNDGVHAENFEAENIRAVIQLARQAAVSASVTREKSDTGSVDLADDVRIGRFAERRFDLLFFHNLETIHLVQPGSADDADRRVDHRWYLRRESSMAAETRVANSTAATPSIPSTSGRDRARTQPRTASSSARSGYFFSTFTSIG